MTCRHGFIGACGECDGAGQQPAPEPRTVSCGCCEGGCACAMHGRAGATVCPFHGAHGHPRVTRLREPDQAERDFGITKDDLALLAKVHARNGGRLCSGLTGCCDTCGVSLGEPCGVCHGVGYHNRGCSQIDGEPGRARWWEWINGGWVRLSLAPGQALAWERGGPNEEGYSSERITWEHQQDRVARVIETDARDCDGRMETHTETECALADLAECFEPDEPRTPDWKRLGYPRSHQRDHSAEAAGY